VTLKSLLFTSLLLVSSTIQASGTVNFLEVDNDVVLFSTSEAKTVASPTCVTTDNANLWTVSLASDSGRAIYSLILTSMAKGEGVALNIESAQDCADKSGVERASKVNLTANVDVQSSSSKGNSIGLYKSDGVTRVGTYLGENSYYLYYADDEPKTERKTFFRQTRNQYSGSDCTGDVWVSRFSATDSKELQRNEFLANGAYFDAELSTKSKPVTNSYVNSSSTIRRRYKNGARHPDQDQLGHADWRATQIYTRILQRGGNSVVSPLSRL
jgi:hypothetical protein